MTPPQLWKNLPRRMTEVALQLQPPPTSSSKERRAVMLTLTGLEVALQLQPPPTSSYKGRRVALLALPALTGLAQWLDRNLQLLHKTKI